MDDTISRQAAIDAVKKHYRKHDNDLLELIAFDIERLPSAQPISENDLIELQDRYGDEVRFVVEDMLSGEE